MLRRRIHLLLLVFIPVFLQAQFARFKRLNVNDGLTSNTVYAITQDSKGNIWCGTELGINKYDGYKVTRYPFDAAYSIGISGSQILDLCVDKDDKLWIGTFMGGLSCLDISTNKFTTYKHDSLDKNSISHSSVYSIIELDDNTLALGTAKGFNIFDKTTKTFKSYLHSDNDKNSPQSNFVKGLSKDKDGNVWIGYPRAGVSKFMRKEGKFVNFTAGNDNKHLRDPGVRHIFLDRDGYLWISLWAAGVTVLDTKTNTFYDNRFDTTGIIKGASGLSLVYSIQDDKEGNIWFATVEAGICKLNKKTSEKIFFKNNPDDAETIGDNVTFTVFEDRAGLLWAGTWRDGLNYFNGNSLLFGHYKHEKGAPNTLVNNNVYCFTEMPDNQVAMGTAASVCFFNTATKTFSTIFMTEKNIGLRPNSQITFIAVDLDGKYWLSTGGAGVMKFDPKTKTYSNYSPVYKTFAAETPYHIVIDKLNNVWVVAPNIGLELYDRKKDRFTLLTHDPNDPNSIPTNNINCAVMDKNGIIWLGTDKGVITLDPVTKKFTQFYSQPIKQGAGNPNVAGLYLDSKNNAWLICTEAILKLNLDTRQAVNLEKLNPVFKTTITQPVEDDMGNFWFPSEQGLLRFNSANNSVTTFKVKDGVQGKEYYGGAIYKLKDGRILIGGNNGFNFFDPKKIVEDKTPPGIMFTDFQVQNKPYPLENQIQYTKEITLSYRDYFFSVDFAAVDFANPLQNKFKYKLVGFNDDWVDIGSQHNITFTNLDHGDYILQVKAANNNGYWNETPLELKITITPPFWRTTWFYLLCSVSGLGIIIGYIKYREKQLKTEKEVLEKKVAERTEELNVEKHKVEEAHKDIKDSILYAKRIQNAILSPQKTLKKAFAESFILYRPKDIVSGDFYWILHIDEPKANKNIVAFAAADCTGHGVPGAFMSMLNSTLLNQTAYNPIINTPADALNFLNKELPKNLRSEDDKQDIKDGMDIAFCLVDLNKKLLRFSGANNPCWIVRNGELIELKPVKQAITASEEYDKKTFVDQEFNLEKGDCVYIFTDGFADQFGGPRGKKYKYKTLSDLLVAINNEPLDKQSQILEKSFLDWKGDLEQVDDVCIIGVRV